MKSTAFKIIEDLTIGGMCVLLFVIIGAVAILYASEIKKRRGR